MPAPALTATGGLRGTVSALPRGTMAGMGEMPLPVDDRYAYWADPPPEPSERLWWWLQHLSINNEFSSRELIDMLAESNNYADNAAKFGVYLWEWHNVLYHVVNNRIAEELQREKPRDPLTTALIGGTDGTRSEDA